MRHLPFLLFAVLVYVLGVMLFNPNAARNAATGVTNQPLPTMSVTALNGTEVWNPETLKGHVTLINFFASWCSPCAEEMSELAALKKQFPNVRFVGIAWNDSPKTLNAWLKKHNNPFEKTWLDAKGDATIALGIRGIPETIIVDANGTMRYRLSGALTPLAREKEIDALIATLLKEAENAP
jgi:cytochrome c biogenesis protein CcmG, thiol:disulfide interchange protein DsbE